MNGSNGPGSSYGRSSLRPSSGGGGVVIWNAAKSGANSEHRGSSNSPARSTALTSTSSSPAAPSASPSTPSALQAAVDQTHELEQKYAQEASEQIKQIHIQAGARRREIMAQINGSSGGSGRHQSGGRRHNNGYNGMNDELKRQLTQESTFEQKQVESIQKQYEAKERAIQEAVQHLAAHYDAGGNGSLPRLGATKNDLHVQNYEINDTSTGAEIPLMASPKSLHGTPTH